MSNATKRRVVDHVQPALSRERVERMWSGIETEERRRRSRRRTVRVVAACTLLCLAGAGAWLGTRPVPSDTLAQAGDRIIGDARATDLALPDGSHASVSSGAVVAVLEASTEATRLRVERGRADFDVRPRERRSFVVEAGEVRVVVRGTRFVVDAEPQDAGMGPLTSLAVSVSEGKVEVQSAHGEVLSRLSAGHRWSMQLAPPAYAEKSALEPTADRDATRAAHADPAEDTRPKLALPRESRVAPRAAAPSPSELFEQANLARIEGRAQAAADAYQKLLSRHPRDARAGISAFELARLRLDSLRDPDGALVALRFALGHNGGGFAAEDAKALRIDALSEKGDLEACREARTQFLESHPASAHRRRVQGACASDASP